MPSHDGRESIEMEVDMKKIMVISVILLLSFPVFSDAQEEGFFENNEIGFSFFTGLPYSELTEEEFYRTLGVNLEWHPRPFISIEPGIFISNTTRDDKNNLTDSVSKRDEDLLGFSIGIFYYHNLVNNLYMYAGPRLMLTEWDYSSKQGDGSRYETDERGRYIMLTLGFKYMFNDHVGIFGDFGLSFGDIKRDRQSWDSSGVLFSDSTEKTDVTALKSGLVGITFYF
jgi:hypothetical protein